jgi:hypothetical protein
LSLFFEWFAISIRIKIHFYKIKIELGPFSNDFLSYIHIRNLESDFKISSLSLSRAWKNFLVESATIAYNKIFRSAQVDFVLLSRELHRWHWKIEKNTWDNRTFEQEIDTILIIFLQYGTNLQLISACMVRNMII